jgi:hypothetical protein
VNPCAHCTVQTPPAGTFWQWTTTPPSLTFVGLQTATYKKVVFYRIWAEGQLHDLAKRDMYVRICNENGKE